METGRGWSVQYKTFVFRVCGVRCSARREIRHEIDRDCAR